MKLKLVIAVALVALLLQPIAVNAESVDMGSAPPPAPVCPDEETIADSVLEKLREKGIDAPDFSELDELEDVKIKELVPINLSSFSGDANEIIKRTREIADTPLTEVIDSPTVSKLVGWLGLGIDLSVLTVSDSGKVISCFAISAGGLWDYLSTLHNCISNVIDAKLAKQAPERLAEEERKNNIESAFQSTVVISKELVSDKTASIFGWS
jgi:hypothetical protein|tara:strand:- start:3244 stop:3873 length:630 start_codon:yes stop_codon:yes gene_type:complete